MGDYNDIIAQGGLCHNPLPIMAADYDIIPRPIIADNRPGIIQADYIVIIGQAPLWRRL